MAVLSKVLPLRDLNVSIRMRRLITSNLPSIRRILLKCKHSRMLRERAPSHLVTIWLRRRHRDMHKLQAVAGVDQDMDIIGSSVNRYRQLRHVIIMRNRGSLRVNGISRWLLHHLPVTNSVVRRSTTLLLTLLYANLPATSLSSPTLLPTRTTRPLVTAQIPSTKWTLSLLP